MRNVRLHYAGIDRQNTLDFSDPLQGRRWLLLLQNDPVSGIRLKPNLWLKRDVVGFSFHSNGLGLRGPSSVKGWGVVFGTSYAMGFGVDIGYNWYELCLAESDWLNLGIPVGTRQLEALFNTCYRGSAAVALVVYHPNFWQHTRMYEDWRTRGGTVFSYMGWETDWWRCFLLRMKKQRRRRDDLRRGKLIVFEHQGVFCSVPAHYSQFDFAGEAQMVAESLGCWQRMLKPFARVVFIRVPIKQELVPNEFSNAILRSTVESYDLGWWLTKEYLQANKHIEFYEPGMFCLSDYNPRDSHWNVAGNAKFAAFVRRLF